MDILLFITFCGAFLFVSFMVFIALTYEKNRQENHINLQQDLPCAPITNHTYVLQNAVDAILKEIHGYYKISDTCAPHGIKLEKNCYCYEFFVFVRSEKMSLQRQKKIMDEFNSKIVPYITKMQFEYAKVYPYSHEAFMYCYPALAYGFQCVRIAYNKPFLILGICVFDNNFVQREQNQSQLQ